jgi:serine phosphatase RsbU (regulator of sigma subunit)
MRTRIARNTLFFRLLKGGLALILLVSASWYLATAYLWARSTTAHQIRETSRLLQIHVLEARRAEKDFLLRDLKKAGFYRHGDTPSLQRHRTAMARVREDIDTLARLTGDEHRQELDILRGLADQTEAPFRELVAAYREKGFVDWGLEGEWRKAAHDFEHHLPKIASAELETELLQLRRHEKDYLLRKDDESSRAVTRALGTLTARVRSLADPEAAAMLADLDSYAAAFEKYLAIDQRIGMTEESGLQGEVRRAAHAIEPGIERVVEEAGRVGRQAHREFVLASGLILLATLGLGGGLFHVFSRSVTGPLAALTAAVVRIGDGQLDTRLDFPSQDEVGVLANTVNGMALSLKRMIAQIHENMERELQIAREIQMSMLPNIFPAFPERREFDVYATIAPAREVGGDFYDFFFVDDDHVCLAIADVSGKGVPASLFMAVSKTLLKVSTGRGRRPDAILTLLNEELCRDNSSCMFVTIFCGVLDVRSGQLEYSNGGHNLPYVLRSGRLTRLENTPGIALGVVAGATYRTAATMLEPGDGLFLYTDGVTEAMDPAGEVFSEQRLEQFLATAQGAPLSRIVDGLTEEIRRFAAGAPQSDDITAVALQYAGPAVG